MAGLPEAEARAILAARRARNGAPFASVEEAALRAGVGRQALEALAGADAFAGTGASRRRAGWEARGVANGPQDLPLFAVAAGTEAAAMAAQAPLVPEPAVTLPDQTEGEAVVEDYLATGMTLRRHPLALLRPRLEALGCGDTRQLNARRAGTKLRLPGLVLIRQRPGSAKGVVFLTVEDEHGVANLVVFERIAARDRAALVSGRLLIAEGRVEREVAQAEVPITHLIVERLIDRSDLLSRLVEIEAAPPRTRTGRRRRSAAPTRCGAPSPAASARSCPAAGTFADARLAQRRRPVRSSSAALPWPARRLGHAMCNLYSITKGQQAIREFTRAMSDRTGNLPPLPGVFPDYAAPIVRNQPEGRELTMARWGMPSPAFALKGRKSDPGVTNVRNVKSPHWRRWLGVEHRCVVPFTSFSEHEVLPDGTRPPVWFAFDESRPLACFAGIWTRWTSVRKVKEGETTNDLFAFLTTDPNREVGAIHPKAMPVILTTPEEIDLWMNAPTEEALALQRPLPDASLVIVARGEKQDGAPAAS